MKRLLISAVLVGVSSIVLSFALIHSVPPATHAATSSTSVCSTLTTTTVWAVISSPYVICSSGVTVGPTATLTIQPGVTVQFSTGVNSMLTIQGGLKAIGTASEPITFTGVVTAPGSWAALYANSTVLTPALVNLSYVTIDGGGAGSSKAQLYADYAVVTMTHSLVRNGSFDGIHMTNNEAGFNIQTTSFISNSRYAVELDTPTTDIQLSDLSASGNGTNGVYLYAQGMHVAGQRRWSNPGIPYFVDYAPYNQPGDDLTIDPGSDLRFNPNFGLSIGGQLKAIGLPDQPITFTAQNHTAGGWYGLTVNGGSANAVAQLDYATIEYGGGDVSGANIVVNHGQIIAHHSNVRYSAKDGLQFNVAASGSILNSQIVSNSQVVTTSYGIRNTVALSTSAILATNDWWGDPNGPAADNLNCSSGHGDKVTNGVLFRPALTGTNLSVEFPLSAASQLALTPRRWFAPADGVSKIYFDLTLRDGNGTPLSGRQTRLHATGSVTITDGGTTDLKGHTLAYITSSTVGDSNVSATLDGLTGCEGVVPPTAKVTFTPPINITDLFPNSPAPYFADNLSLTPMPVVTGITETIHAKLTNPLTVPITVDVSFGFVQSSIGLAFGPIKDITQTIPASSTVSLAADFMPLVAGHYCVQVSYAITAIGSTHLLRPQASRQLKQFNFNPEQGPTIPPDGKETLDKADKSWNKVKKLSPRGTNIQTGILDAWWGWAKDSAKKISQALGFDPPRQDYNVSTLPVWYRWPHVQPDVNISIAHADALNAVSDALADVIAYGNAAAVAMDRYSGASQAGDLTWAAQQANAQLQYQKEFGQALLNYADKLDSFVNVLKIDNAANVTITVGDVISYQQSLSNTGFTLQEQDNAKLVGFTDADIEELRQEIIAADPNEIAGSVLDIYTSEADISRQVGNALLYPNTFAPGFSVGGSAGLLQTAAVTPTGNSLAQINNTVSTFQLGNPFTATTSITLTARQLDLPADWAVDVSPSIISLAQGQQVTVTVTILTGSPAPQGSMPRVAVEGYANNQLLGGVVVDVVVPNYMPYFLHTYLPLIKK